MNYTLVHVQMDNMKTTKPVTIVLSNVLYVLPAKTNVMLVLMKPEDQPNGAHVKPDISNMDLKSLVENVLHNVSLVLNPQKTVPLVELTES
jgi:hypothetical protein